MMPGICHGHPWRLSRISLAFVTDIAGICHEYRWHLSRISLAYGAQHNYNEEKRSPKAITTKIEMLNTPRMGPIFGGMLMSGKKVADMIIERLK